MTNLSGHNDEGEAYLAAIYGGREITANLAAKVADERLLLASADTFVQIGADIEYNPSLGQLRVLTDTKEIRTYVIPVHEGYWGQPIGYRIRNRGSIAVMLDKAEAMFGWPIYREAVSLPERQRTLILTALENARESLENAIDNDHYAHDDGEGDDLRASLLAGWAELEARLS